MERARGRRLQRKSGFRVMIAPSAAVLLTSLLLTDGSRLCLAAVLAAFVHELGHLAAARLLGIPMRALRLDLLGARLDTCGRMLTYGEEWLLCAAGPLFSLLLSAAMALFWKAFFFARLVSCASLLLGALNLLPIRSFDGGRMLSALLSATLGERVSERALTVSSFLFLFLLWSCAVYCLLRLGNGLSLFCFSMSLFSRFFSLSDGG